jgi:signal transduction histidine kinase
MTRRLRLSFRTRLGLIITVVFITAGAGLLAVQYFVVEGLFASAIAVTTISCGEGANDPGKATSGPVSGTPTGCSVINLAGPGAQSGPGDGPAPSGAVIQQSRFLSDSVSGGLLFWSIVMLIVFAVIAAAIAFWLARRSLDRIGEVTSAARAISERDLGRRLDLPGPDDEIKELGDTFDGMLDRLQLAFKAQDRFVANASHELRTPLTTVRTALEIPLEQGSVPTDLQPAVRTALRATEQSERLITALLVLARGRTQHDATERVDLAALAAAEVQDLADAAATRRVGIEVVVSAAATEGDPALLARAVRNLLDNGIRHNLTRGGRLWLRVDQDGADSIVEVENTGDQLDAPTVALLTEPFYRGDASRTSSGEGVGLGLAIVESIVLAHGGALRLKPREGGGLLATLRLPAAPA